MFEREILRKIFGPCKDDQTGVLRKEHNQGLHGPFQRPGITKEILEDWDRTKTKLNNK